MRSAVPTPAWRSPQKPRLRTRALLLALCVALPAAGCGTLGVGTHPAERLLEESRAALSRRDYEEGYRLAKQVRERYGGRPESDEAYWLAAYGFQTVYHRHRHTEPASLWVAEEPAYLFDWLEEYFARGPDADLQGRSEALFLGMDYGFYRAFRAAAGSRPGFDGWRIAVEDDNGIIEEVRVESLESAGVE